MASNWTEQEVEAAVKDYFSMLCLELSRGKYNKAEHRRALMEGLNSRTKSSVEMKHQNISAALIEMGIPYIDGYKPLWNYERKLLPDVIYDVLKNDEGLQALFQQDSESIPEVPSVADFLAVFEAPPKREKRQLKAIAEPRAIYNPTGINYLEREAQNIKLGDAGEAFVINFEKARLIRLGKKSLADRIEQVSETKGPSAGFDILSFEESGSDRYIEAKTTKYGKETPFFVTPNELHFSSKNADRYFLYRVFKFGAESKVFALQGHLEEQCKLEASEYRAWIG